MPSNQQEASAKVETLHRSDHDPQPRLRIACDWSRMEWGGVGSQLEHAANLNFVLAPSNPKLVEATHIRLAWVGPFQESRRSPRPVKRRRWVVRLITPESSARPAQDGSSASNLPDKKQGRTVSHQLRDSSELSPKGSRAASMSVASHPAESAASLRSKTTQLMPRGGLASVQR